MMEGGTGEKMDDDDEWTRTRKLKGRHKFSDDESEEERKSKKGKQNVDQKNKKLDKYQTCRIMNSDGSDNDNGVTSNQNGKNTNENLKQTPQTEFKTPTLTQTGTTPKQNPTKRQIKDQTDGIYDDGWVKNPHYTTFIMEKENKNNDKTMKYPHPMEVAKMLKNIGVTKYNDMKSVGRGKFQISFDKPKDAEQLINSKLLKESFGFTIFVPTRFKESIGVVRNVAPSLTEDEITENIQCENNIKVIRTERIKRRTEKDKLEPTYSIKIFVRGETLPKYVKIYRIHQFVDPYIFPLKICVKCWRFGHREKFCKSKEPRCCKCGHEHTEDRCEELEPKCINCSGNHKASSRDCPERSRQDLIRQDMAMNKTTYFEASDKYPKRAKQNLQARLDSLREFPLLPNSNASTNTIINKQKRYNINLKPNFQIPHNEFNTNNIEHQFLPNPYKTTDIEKITQMIKEDLIRQFNLNNMIGKIKAIQQTIIKSTSKTDTIDQDLLLINISEDLNKIINPELITQTMKGNQKTTNHGTEQTKESNNNPK